MSEWKQISLGNLVESISKRHAFNKDRLIFLNTSDIFNGKVLNNEYTDINTLPGQAKKSIQKNDILFSEIRPANRRFAYIDFESEDYVVSTKLMVLRPKNNDILPKYLYYFLTSEESLRHLQEVAESRSGTFPQITFSEVKEMVINLPPLKEQQRIVEVIDSLTEKIELNLKINETLEEMAMALYKHWFVDFGPFQDGEFVESELGMIPKGWRVISCYDLANYINGKAFKTNQLVDNDGLPVIKIAELKSGITNSTKFYNGDIEPKYLLQNGDILFAWSASLGVFIWAKGKAVLNQHIFNVKPNGTLSKSMIYFTLKNIIQEFIEIAASRATTMGHITKEHLIDKKIALPPDELLVKVDEKMSNYYQMILSNMLEVERLTQIRDYLLPRLLSGEIDVSKAEKQVEEVL